MIRKDNLLGHVVSGDNIKVEHLTVEAIEICKPPKNISEIRSFLGLARYYHRFKGCRATNSVNPK